VSGLKLRYLFVVYIVLALLAVIIIAVNYWDISIENVEDRFTYKVDTERDEVSMYLEITPDLEGKMLEFFTQDTYVQAYVDDEQIYSWGRETILTGTPGSAFKFINIPLNSAGKTLYINFDYVYGYKLTSNISVLCGTYNDIVLSLMRDDMLDMFFNISNLLLAISIFVIVCISARNKVYDRENYYLGLAGIVIVLWSNHDLYINQLLVPDSIARYYLFYLMVYITPLLLLCFFNEIVPIRWFKQVLSLSVLGVVTLMLLQLFQIADCSSTLLYFLVLACFDVIYALCFLVRGKMEKFYKIAFPLTAVMIVLNILIWFFNKSAVVRTTLIKFGIFIYLSISLSISIRRLLDQLLEAGKAERLRTALRTDVLTGLNNRYAFERDVLKGDLRKLCLISLDINNLKYFNDYCGHAAGDKLIVDSAKILRHVYNTVYRTGGDEFIAIEYGLSEEQLEMLKNQLVAECKAYQDEQIVIEVACGYSRYHLGDPTFEQILKRSDDAMYVHKAELKSHSAIKYQRAD
jgi:diguanylate cyclase (GGDEF)-like protein